jgi:hypothetical protein
MELGIERELASQIRILIFFYNFVCKELPGISTTFKLVHFHTKNVGNLLPSFCHKERDSKSPICTGTAARELMIW